MEGMLESHFTCVIYTTVTLGVKQSSCCGTSLCASFVTKTKGDSCCRCRNTTFVMFKNRAIHEVLETCRRTCAECKVELNIIAFKRHLCQAQLDQLPTIKLPADYESLLRGSSYKCTVTKPRESLDGEQIFIGQVSATVHSTCDGDGVAIVYLQENEKYARLSLHAANHLVVERQEAEKKACENVRRAETAELEFMFGPLDDDRVFAFESSDESDIESVSSSGLPFVPPAFAVWTAMTVANMSHEERQMYNCVLNDDALAAVLPRRSRRTGVRWKLVAIHRCHSDRRHYIAPFHADHLHVRVLSSRNVKTRRQLVPQDFL
ncbi:hypothetical protein SARC_03805 [Sphaeroforma arctica JP610]|uniref:Uncharacterized protein n=1 Tax=Sphaeroforma arctica JP610 TaxID=667725 RepID=A0A0L0G4L0_9EUKA|nr:hypothetical protein SARC_03805 [Sphaeroforma arctica JP610]KNC83985.1 hypothetical protein SARC_03805 [Sphaeroforma arctica JP610]|eukprot:XP_014157887.1 hypothetical protein SARC_03805 [Sphaeroforma arctica JP610]